MVAIIRNVPASELSSKSLRAKDYVLQRVKVTLVETVERNYWLHVPREMTVAELHNELAALSEEELIKRCKEGEVGEVQRVSVTFYTEK